MLASDEVNEAPTLIAFVEGCSKEVAEAVENAVKEVATAEAEADPAATPKVTYTIARVNDPLAPQVRAVTGLGSPTVDPVVVLVNLPKNASFFKAEAASTYDAAAIGSFVQGWRADTLTGERLDLQAGQERAKEKQKAQQQAQEQQKAQRFAKLQALIRELKQGAQAGDPQAQLELQRVYDTLQQQGLPAEAIEALSGPDPAAGLGAPPPARPAQPAAGVGGGEFGARAAAAAAAAGAAPGGRPTLAQTIAHLQAKAVCGDPEAQRDLAMCYAQGKGVEKNIKEGAKWCAKAFDTLGPKAEAGEPKAMELLADCCAFLQRDEEACKWWGKAAALGSKVSEYHLGIAIQGGRGVPKDAGQAAMIFRRLKRGATDPDQEVKEVATLAANALKEPVIAAALAQLEFREDAMFIGGVGVLAAVGVGVYWKYFRK
jgi:TPR repeat protein